MGLGPDMPRTTIPVLIIGLQLVVPQLQQSRQHPHRRLLGLPLSRLIRPGI